MKIHKRESNRMPARRRYKIEKKVRRHNKKMRRADKKTAAKRKQPIINVPNHCPFKEDILKQVEELKKQKEEEKQKQRDLAKLERQKKKKKQVSKTDESSDETVVNVEIPDSSIFANPQDLLKVYYTEFQKIIDDADVILEVVDARDPMGTRCIQVEKAVHESAGKKKLIIVLNNADLVPQANLIKWLKYIRKTTLCVPLKTDRSSQFKKKLQRAAPNPEICIGIELLMTVLEKYCEDNGKKSAIRVGIVGLPNVGKGSLSVSLKRKYETQVNETEASSFMKEVRLASNMFLLNANGIVRATGNDSIASLRNVENILSVADPITPANAILQRINKKKTMELYNIGEYNSPDEFYNLIAEGMGKFKKGGIPNAVAAAKEFLKDHSAGKITYFTDPPVEEPKASGSVLDFNSLTNYVALEKDVMQRLFKHSRSGLQLVKSWAMVDAVVEEKMEDDNKEEEELLESTVVAAKKVNKKKKVSGTKKEDPQIELEEKMEEVVPAKKVNKKKGSGMKKEDSQMEKMEVNIEEEEVVAVKKVDKKKKSKSGAVMKKQNPDMEQEGSPELNKVQKTKFKKTKKQSNRKEKVQLSTGLKSFSIKGNDDYDFDVDHSME